MSNPHILRVVLVDDNEMVRTSLTILLGTCEEVEVIAEARDGQEAVETCCQLQPDVVIIDLVMPRMDGATATRAILNCHPTARIIAITSTVEPGLIAAALDAGVEECLPKTAYAKEIIEAVLKAN